MRQYEQFARVYDEVMDQEVYQQWLAFTLSSIQQFSKRDVEHVMEVACGTGEIAHALATYDVRVTGVDLSPVMLQLASKKSSSDSVQFIQADMRSLENCPIVDAITLFSDSLCYLLDEEDVKKTFQAVYDHLEEGGVFLFDVHSLYQMQNVFPGYQYVYSTEELMFAWESYEDELPGSVEHVITMFLKNEEGLFERHQEYHKERSFSISDYTTWLKETGFTMVETGADFGISDVEPQSTRWFFICRK